MKRFLQGLFWVVIGFLVHFNELWSWIMIGSLLITEGIFAISTKNKRERGPLLSYKDSKEFLDSFDRYHTIKTEKDWAFVMQNSEFLLFVIPRNPEEYYTKTGEWISWEDFLTRKKVK